MTGAAPIWQRPPTSLGWCSHGNGELRRRREQQDDHRHVAGDTAVESTEGFTLTLSNPSAGTTLGTATTATGTILNDDSGARASLSIAATKASLNEGNSGSTAFTFLRVARTGSTARGPQRPAAPSAGSGTNSGGCAPIFTGGAFPTGTVSFAAGETSKTITVNVAGDSAVEPNENFSR